MAIADNMPNDQPGDMARRIADLERAVRELRAARNLDKGSITPEPGMGIRTGDFDGTDFAHPGTVGNYFGGDGLVLNQAYFRPGSVSNDALTNPVVATVLNDFQSNFAVTPMDFGANTVPTIITSTITAPTGFTQALVTATTWGTAVNPNTSGGVDGTGTDYLLCRTWIDGAFSQAFPTGVSGSNGQATASSGLAAVVDASGGSFQIKTQLGSAVAGFGAANPSNGARVAASIVWLR